MVINNEFQNLKKGKLSVNEYSATFTEKKKLVPHLIPIELSKVDKFANGLPTEFGPTVKLEKTLKEAIWSAKSLEIQIREHSMDKSEEGEKRKIKCSSKSNKETRFSKFNDKELESSNKAQWCEKYKRKQFGRCTENMTCFMYGKTGHYVNDTSIKMTYSHTKKV